MIELNVLQMYLSNKCLFSFLYSFFFVLILVPILIKVAYKFSILDKPDGNLKKQDQSVPYLGGLAIFISFLISLFLCNLLPFLNYSFYLGLTFLLIIGLIDDLYILKPQIKLAGQIFASFFLIISLPIEISFQYSFIVFFWFLTIINSFNLIDVMDGLAVTVAMWVSSCFIFYCFCFNNISIALIITAFLGSLFGFFYFNKPSAKIYLGDSGSHLIGGFLSSLPFFIFNKNSLDIKFLVIPVLVLAVPLLELAALILIRIYKKIPFYLGSPDHFSLIMQQNGWTKQGILLATSLFCFILFLFSYLYIFNFVGLNLLLLFSSIILVAWIFFFYLFK